VIQLAEKRGKNEEIEEEERENEENVDETGETDVGVVEDLAKMLVQESSPSEIFAKDSGNSVNVEGGISSAGKTKTKFKKNWKTILFFKFSNLLNILLKILFTYPFLFYKIKNILICRYGKIV